MAVFPVEPRGYRDVVPKSWEMPPLQPCWGLSSVRALLLPPWDEALGDVALWAGQWAQPPCMSIKWVGCVESCGAIVLPAVGLPWEGLGKSHDNGAPLWGSPCMAPPGDRVPCLGMQERGQQDQ